MIEYRLSGNEFKVLHYLQNNEASEISRETLSKTLNISTKHIGNILQRLEMDKIITIVRLDRPHKYLINDKQDWRIN